MSELMRRKLIGIASYTTPPTSSLSSGKGITSYGPYSNEYKFDVKNRSKWLKYLT